jgi:lysophospholipase L1-like esterase
MSTRLASLARGRRRVARELDDGPPRARSVRSARLPAIVFVSVAIATVCSHATDAGSRWDGSRSAAAGVHQATRSPADQPSARTDPVSIAAHQRLLQKRMQGRIDVYFEGDSIVRRWGATDYPDLLAHWNENFHGWNAADFGWGADRTENILWRLQNGELDDVNPKVIVLLAGTNNVGKEPADESTAAEIVRGVKAIVDACRAKAPDATIILTAIFPRNDNMAVVPTILRINRELATLADGKRVRFLDINDRLADKDGKLVDGVMNERDQLHPTLKGYQMWADALKPILRELLGPPAATDLAPPPTGVPDAARQ